jgi:hypothetical protein
VLEYLKDLLNLTGTAKQIAAVVGIIGVMVAPKAFRDIPSTSLIATVSPAEQATSFQLNLNLMLKCYAAVSAMCSRDVFELRFPGISMPAIQVPGDFQQNIQAETLSTKDSQGRNVHRVRLLRPQKGGDTMFISVGINGRVVAEDLRFQSTTGEDRLRHKFKCVEQKVPPPGVSQINCYETITWLERVLFLLPFS